MKKIGLLLLLFIVAVFFIAGCSQQNMVTNARAESKSYINSNNEANGKNIESTSEANENRGNTTAKKHKPIWPVIPKDQTVQRKVYLTFDDGPNPMNTPMILDILKTYKVKATFFVVGTNIEKNKGILREIAKDGHAIGNHTYNHKYNEIYVGPEAFMKSIQQNENLIFNLTGQKPKIVREPGGTKRNQAIKNALAKSGYKLYDWNVDSYDSRSSEPDASKIIENVTEQAVNPKLWPHMVILMHDGSGHINTVRALPTIIEMLKSHGFAFEVLQ